MKNMELTARDGRFISEGVHKTGLREIFETPAPVLASHHESAGAHAGPGFARKGRSLIPFFNSLCGLDKIHTFVLQARLRHLIKA